MTNLGQSPGPSLVAANRTRDEGWRTVLRNTSIAGKICLAFFRKGTKQILGRLDMLYRRGRLQGCCVWCEAAKQ